MIPNRIRLLHNLNYSVQIALCTTHIVNLKTQSPVNCVKMQLKARPRGKKLRYWENNVAKVIPISLLHVPSIMRSSMRNMWRPGKPFAHPRPVRSRSTDAWLYGLYSKDCVPLPALKPICKFNGINFKQVQNTHVHRNYQRAWGIDRRSVDVMLRVHQKRLLSIFSNDGISQCCK